MMEVDDCPALHLDGLPAELLLHIFQYLDVEFILRAVSKVCNLFHELASDEATWKVRVAKRFPGQYPALPPPSDFCWAVACARREKEARMWKMTSNKEEEEESKATITCPTAHYAAVDSVHVMEKVVVSGSRDRGISVWSIDQVLAGGEENSKPCLRNPDMHKGWVWSFCSEGETLVSGSWDNTVKFWQVTPTELKESRRALNLKVAVLSTDILGDRVAAATYDKKVVMLDRREGPRKCSFYKVHSKPVLAVKLSERQVWSLSEDQTLAIYDRVAGKKLKKVPLPGSHFPICMSWQGNCLWVGDKGGNLHLVDTTDDAFEVIDTVSSGHSGRVTSMHAGLGSLVTASSDGDIRVLAPTRKPTLINLLKNPDCGEVAQVSYNEKNQILAAGFSNNTVKTWAARQ